jgi:flagellar basal body-associated protein FliL
MLDCSEEINIIRNDNQEQATNYGMQSKKLWILATIVTIIVAAVIGGLVGALVNKSKTNSHTSNTLPQRYRYLLVTENSFQLE